MIRATLVAALLAALPTPTRAAEPQPVDPDTLLVPQPEEPDPRDPAEAVNRLLRVEASILEKAEELDINLARRTDELEQLRRQKKVVEADLAEATDRFDKETQALERARSLMRRRLRTIIQLQRVEPYQLLFSASDYGRFERRVRTLRELLTSDKERIAHYKAQLERWRKSKADLERRRNNLSRTEQKIEYLLRELAWDRQEKAALLKAVRTKSSYYGKASAEIEGIDKELQAKVEKLRKEDAGRLWFEENKGRLIRRPIRSGRIVRRFGHWKNRKLGTTTYNPGLDMVPPTRWDGKSDVEVMAMYYGWVVHAGWLRGLGNTVIIDHTRGWMSLYGHLDRIDVKVGDKVKTGTQIGLMGDSGSLWGKRLHLQVRKDGKAVDPAPWFP